MQLIQEIPLDSDLNGPEETSICPWFMRAICFALVWLLWEIGKRVL